MIEQAKRMIDVTAKEPYLLDGRYYVETLADIGIVRCEDCRHSEGEPIADGRLWCLYHGRYMYFCSDSYMKKGE